MAFATTRLDFLLIFLWFPTRLSSFLPAFSNPLWGPDLPGFSVDFWVIPGARFAEVCIFLFSEIWVAPRVGARLHMFSFPSPVTFPLSNLPRRGLVRGKPAFFSSFTGFSLKKTCPPVLLSGSFLGLVHFSFSDLLFSPVRGEFFFCPLPAPPWDVPAGLGGPDPLGGRVWRLLVFAGRFFEPFLPLFSPRFTRTPDSDVPLSSPVSFFWIWASRCVIEDFSFHSFSLLPTRFFANRFFGECELCGLLVDIFFLLHLSCPPHCLSFFR